MVTKSYIDEELVNLNKALQLIRGYLDIDNLIGLLADLNIKCSDISLWNDSSTAHSALSERARISKIIDSFTELEEEYNYYTELLVLVNNDSDNLLDELAEGLTVLREKVKKKEVECLFAEEADENDCFIEIQSGAGGTESNDWSNMLLRMYIRWAEIYHNFKTEIVHKLDGEETGVKSAVIKIRGYNAYGWSKTESGIHRLVRISPFNSSAKRHTTFTSILVSPVMNENIDIQIHDKDLRIDTYKASGAGGQHVNKTESAVRITHIPSGIVVQCQNNRSQHQNLAEAHNLLRSRLYQLKLQEKEKKMAQEHSKRCNIGWGNQIRSYVMHPYQMVKDIRTGHETGNVNSVLDGDLDSFIIAALTKKVM
ncbi:peptide chain release factor 2 [Ehrlichia ruminantium]|uniref:peptide chain release factor 2 n=1 Tax=Ehrlichia ruminantium TaxID=779 RepID=UPI00130D6EC5|nr:peptide chain release factor 2 [Ehrlichia ruminantium]QGR02436.1 peptide chain release factor 2 [Ehrlichia ruminantium]